MSQNHAAVRAIDTSQSPEANRAVIRRWIEDGWNKRNVNLLDELCAPDVVELDPGGLTIHGVDDLKTHLGGLMSAFPDVNITIEDLVAEGDVVIWRGVFHGTHKGTLMNIPATGRTVAGPGLVEFRLADGKIAEVWAMYDLFGMLQQIGAIPEPA